MIFAVKCRQMIADDCSEMIAPMLHEMEKTQKIDRCGFFEAAGSFLYITSSTTTTSYLSYRSGSDDFIPSVFYQNLAYK